MAVLKNATKIFTRVLNDANDLTDLEAEIQDWIGVTNTVEALAPVSTNVTQTVDGRGLITMTVVVVIGANL
ncbi:hypothetical protein LCGC14_0146050 [marine sediment metagenome]|uniref:Uncharacterized protein n=1 Tax=marine sediment metagenome TaxID=412755 RepID=A0A0F9V3D9_9ZZZZ